MVNEKLVGKITHFFTNIKVAVIKLSGTLNVNDTIRIKGASTNFKQKIGSIQIEHKSLTSAKKGQDIGVKVKDRVREGDAVYLVPN